MKIRLLKKRRSDLRREPIRELRQIRLDESLDDGRGHGHDNREHHHVLDRGLAGFVVEQVDELVQKLSRHFTSFYLWRAFLPPDFLPALALPPPLARR